MSRHLAVPLALAILSLWPACGTDPPRSAEVPTFEPRLVTLPPGMVKKCLKNETLKAACPTRVPRVESGAWQHVTGPRRDWPVFSAEWNAPFPKLSEKNAPPRSVHLVVHGEDRHMFAFKWPTELRSTAEPIDDRRTDAVLLDTPTWGGLRGSLVMAPSYPHGGIDGDHLVFRWAQGGDGLYAVSLHAWRPLDESIATLRAVVESLP